MFTFLKSSKCTCTQSLNNRFLLRTDCMMHYKELSKIMKQIHLQSSLKEYFELLRISKPLKYSSVATHMYLFSTIWRMWGEEKVTKMFYMNSDDIFLHLQLSHHKYSLNCMVANRNQTKQLSSLSNFRALKYLQQEFIMSRK